MTLVKFPFRYIRSKVINSENRNGTNIQRENKNANYNFRHTVEKCVAKYCYCLES